MTVDTSGSDPSNNRFQPTAWTRILQARDGSEATVREVMGHLIQLYWKPVYFHLRRKGYSIEDAEDLTQHFFMLLMKREALKTVDPAKGKFRTFLLASLNNFLCDEYDRRNAKKRVAPVNVVSAEKEYSEQHTFEKDWAMVVLDRAFTQLREGSPREARILEAQRTGNTPYRQLAEEMDLSEANVKALALRGREKLRHLILEELRETVTHEGDEQEELRALFQAFSV